MVVLPGSWLRLFALSLLPLSRLLLAGPQGTACDALAAEPGNLTRGKSDRSLAAPKRQVQRPIMV